MGAILDHGGWVLGTILVLSLAAWTLILSKYLQLREQERGGTDWVSPLLRDVTDRPAVPAVARDSLVGRLVNLALTSARPDATLFDRVLRPRLRFEAAALRRHLDLIGTMAASLPLLGLLGTVFGMIVTFEALTLHGAAEADQLAAGVSQALLTTQAGLVCALPALVARGYLTSRIRRFLEQAELCLHQSELALRDGAPPGGGR